MGVFKTFAQNLEGLKEMLGRIFEVYDIARVEKRNSIFEVRAWKRREK